MKVHPTFSLWDLVLGYLRQCQNHPCCYNIQLPYRTTPDVGCQPPLYLPSGDPPSVFFLQLCRTTTLSVITPRGGFVRTFQPNPALFLFLLVQEYECGTLRWYPYPCRTWGYCIWVGREISTCLYFSFNPILVSIPFVHYLFLHLLFIFIATWSRLQFYTYYVEPLLTDL